jgi:hypothetical protein
MLVEPENLYFESGERAEQDDPKALLNSHEKNETDKIDFIYYVGPWSVCSQTCGWSGYRVSND